MDNPLHVVDGCEIHYGERAPSPQHLSDPACKIPTVCEFPRRTAKRTMQDEIDAHTTAWKLELYSKFTQSGPCPLCPSSSAPNVRVAQSMVHDEPPTHFFIAVELPVEAGADDSGSFTAPSPSPCVSAHGETYRLCAVVFQATYGIGCFLCQAFYRGCWRTYHSCSSGDACHVHEYKTSPFKELGAEPVFFAYVREDEADWSVHSSRDDEDEQSKRDVLRRERQAS